MIAQCHFKTGVCLDDAQNKQLRITLRFTNMVDTALGCQRIIFEPLNFSGEVKICSGLDFDTIYELAAGWDQTQETGSSQEKQGNLNFWTCQRKQFTDGLYCIQARTRRSKINLFSSFRLASDQALNPRYVEREKFVGAEFSLQLQESRLLLSTS